MHNTPGAEAMFAIRFGTQYTQGAQGEFYKGPEWAPAAIKGQEAMMFTMQPNPAVSEVRFNYELGDAMHHVQLTAMDGRIVQRFNNLSGTGSLQYDASDLSAGVYLVAVYDEQGLIGQDRLVIVRQ